MNVSYSKGYTPVGSSPNSSPRNVDNEPNTKYFLLEEELPSNANLSSITSDKLDFSQMSKSLTVKDNDFKTFESQIKLYASNCGDDIRLDLLDLLGNSSSNKLVETLNGLLANCENDSTKRKSVLLAILGTLSSVQSTFKTFSLSGGNVLLKNIEHYVKKNNIKESDYDLKVIKDTIKILTQKTILSLFREICNNVFLKNFSEPALNLKRICESLLNKTDNSLLEKTKFFPRPPHELYPWVTSIIISNDPASDRIQHFEFIRRDKDILLLQSSDKLSDEERNFAIETVWNSNRHKETPIENRANRETMSSDLFRENFSKNLYYVQGYKTPSSGDFNLSEDYLELINSFNRS